MSVEHAFAVKDALVDLTRAAIVAAAPGDPFDGVEVHESWPIKGVQGQRSILFLDFEGDEQGATMKAGGGTRDDTVSLDVAVAVWANESDPRVVRTMTSPITNALKALVRAEGAPRVGGAFGVPGVRQPSIRSYKVVEYVLDGGKRECDVHLTLQWIGRNAVGA